MDKLLQEIQDFEDNIRENPEVYKEIVLACASMLIVNAETGTIVYSTEQAEKVFGYEMMGELKGKNIKDVIPQRFHNSHDKYISDYIEKPTVRLMGERSVEDGRKVKLLGVTRSGDEIPLEIGLRPWKIFGKKCVVATILKSRE